MRRATFAAAVVLGLVIALLGSQPLWGAAVAALLLFPIACAAALGPRGQGRGRSGAPFLATLLAGVAGGLLATLALRLAFDAPDWVNPTSADCGGPSTAVQQLVVWAGAVIFAASAAPVAVSLATIARGLGARATTVTTTPLTFFPLAVAASAVALVGASFITNC